MDSELSNLKVMKAAIQQEHLQFENDLSNLNASITCSAIQRNPSCCSPLYQCDEGFGGCDSDDDCKGNDLICGTDNCGPGWPSDFDCCRK